MADLSCSRIPDSDDVMPSEIVKFHGLQPLLSTFCAVLESSLPR